MQNTEKDNYITQDSKASRDYMARKTNSKITRNFTEAEGELNYRMTNDFMFISVLQQSETVLRSFICALLHLADEAIQSLVIENRIEPAKHITEKTFVLDINLLLNGNKHINLEMQVINYGNWPERSLGYLCRAYDNLLRGEDYINTRSALHIGILDFNLENLPPEFYGKYKLMNVKNHTIYTGKFELAVLNLKQISLATEEDKKYQIDHWAKLFKAKTWRDVQMLAQSNQAIAEAAEVMLKLSADPEFREYYEARRDTIIHEQVQKRLLAESQAKLAENEAKLADSEAMLAENEAKLAENEAKLAENEAKLAESKTKLAESKTKLAESKTKLADSEAKLAENEAKLIKNKALLAEKDAENASLKQQLAKLQAQLNSD